MSKDNPYRMKWPRLPWPYDGRPMECRLPVADHFAEFQLQEIERIWARDDLTDQTRGHLFRAAGIAWACLVAHAFCDGGSYFGECAHCRDASNFVDALAEAVKRRVG